jgi:endosialidase-like protein
MKTGISQVLIVSILVCLGFSPRLHAVSPPPDGGYPGGNTAEGQNALLSLTTGSYNTAVGLYSLLSLSDTQFNTGVGAGTLLANTSDENTAIGAGALLSNTDGEESTATGAFALFSNTVGSQNTANGAFALLANTEGSYNTATGDSALLGNTTGTFNTAYGLGALTGNTTGSFNTAVGQFAGAGVTTASNVICIGAAGQNVSNSCFIGQISNQSSPSGAAVFVNSDGKLGTTVSSRRFKEDIKSMDKASEAILALKPVTFRYKKEFDPTKIAQFGLVAEEVEKVNPDLVVRDKEGKPYSVRYDQVNAMLLNEFLKEHRAVQEQQKEIQALKMELREQRDLIRKVSAKVEATKLPKLATNNP